MSNKEAEFLKSLRATFQVEAGDHLQVMYSALLELEKSSAVVARTAIIETVYREVHSLKGAARAVNRIDIESVCQKLESLLAGWKHNERTLLPEDFDTLHRAIDTIADLLSVPEPEPPSEETKQLPETPRELDATHSVPPIEIDAPQYSGFANSERFAGPDFQSAETTDEQSIDANNRQSPVSAVEENVAARTGPPLPVRERFSSAETVRISTDKLDQLLLKAEEMLAVKTRARQRSTDLRELGSIFETWQKQWAKIQPRLRDLRAVNAGMAGNQSLNGNHSAANDAQLVLLQFMDWNQACVRSLEEKFSALARAADQEKHWAGKLVDDLLEDSKKLLMLPFSTLFAMFPKLARDLCRDQGKQVEVVIQGGEVEIDKRILEEMKDPLIHVLRNCIDHGVRTPAERSQGGKPPRAVVTITALQLDGNKVEIRVSDDGAGINLERVKAAAVKRGILTDSEARKLTEQDSLSLIFHSDISSSAIITEISGRGLGLAIVREKVERLGGRVTVETKPQVGTTFRILIPITVATFRGILVKAAGQLLVIPAANVALVDRVRRDKIKSVGNRETISLNGRAVSLVRLDTVLEIRGNETIPEPSPFLSFVVLETGDTRMAFGVDEVLNEEEVLVKPLSKPLARVRNVAGATVLGSGTPVPVLHIGDLLKSAVKVGTSASFASPIKAEGETQRRSILVAEDSITSRMLLKNILESAGYEVTTTVDGMDALTTLKTGSFDLLVSDVEMPRMNGFDLTEQVRSDKRLEDLPVVLVTALVSPKDRERGIDAGADAFLVKQDFEQSNLLEAVRRLI